MAKNAAAAALQASFRGSVAPAPSSEAAAPEPTPAAAGTETARAWAQANRVGKVNISAWLPADYKKSLALCKAYTSTTNDKLMAEALNMLFEKYKVPTVSE